MNKITGVTGATGTIGKAVEEQLKAHGAQVRLVSRRGGVSFDEGKGGEQ